jgi:hypothetical protein
MSESDGDTIVIDDEGFALDDEEFSAEITFSANDTFSLESILNHFAAPPPSLPSGIFKIDSFTEYPFRNRASVLVHGKLFDAMLLVDFITHTKDFRNPLSSEPFTSEDLTLIQESAGVTELSKPAAELPKSCSTSAVAYFKELIHVCEQQLLASCELASLGALHELQANNEQIWETLQRSVLGLLKFDPLQAAQSITTCSQSFKDALASSEEDFVYEPNVLVVVATSVISMANVVARGVLSKATHEIISQILSVKLSRLLFH